CPPPRPITAGCSPCSPTCARRGTGDRTPGRGLASSADGRAAGSIGASQSREGGRDARMGRPRDLAAAVARRRERGALRRRRGPGVALVTTPSGPGSPLVSRDGRSAYLVAQFRAGDDSAHESVATRLEHELAGDRAVTLGGEVVANKQVGDIIGEDIGRAEL